MADNAKDIIAAAVKKMAEAVNFLEEDLKTYRAGKANPAVFNSVMVDYYSNPTPVPQVASITVPDARTTRTTASTSASMSRPSLRTAARSWSRSPRQPASRLRYPCAMPVRRPTTS